MNEVLKVIKERRSIRVFNSKQVLDRDIEDILMAGSYAPSAFNNQPWKFTVIQNKKMLSEISDICIDIMLKSGNEVLMQAASSPNFNCFYNAPTVILISMDTNITGAIIDIAIAAQNMCLAAQSLGLGSVFLGGFGAAFYEEKFVKDFFPKLNIPDNFQPFFAVSIGYRTTQNPDAPPRNKDISNYIR